MAVATGGGTGTASAEGTGAGGEGKTGAEGGEGGKGGEGGGEGGEGAKGGEGGSGDPSLLGGAGKKDESLLGGAGKEDGDVKDGDLLSAKNADGTEKTPEKIKEDKAASDKAAADKVAAEAKPGDLLSKKNADGSDKSEEQVKADQAAAEKVKTDAELNAKGAPEKYTDFTLPEGVQKLSEGESTELHTLLKKHNLSQAASQELVDFQAKIAQGQATAAYEEFITTTDKWAEDTKKFFGANYQEKLGVSAKAIERFGPEGLRKMLDDTKVGNHPLMNQFFYEVGQAISEDKFAEGKPETKEKSDARKFYPNMTGHKT